MKPMGRRFYKDTKGKHGLRLFGKFSAWWSTMIEPNKTKEKEQVKKDIQKEMSDFKKQLKEAEKNNPDYEQNKFMGPG